MNQSEKNDRDDRKKDEWQLLSRLSGSAGFWTIERPVPKGFRQCWMVTIHGRAIAGCGSESGKVQFAEEQIIRFELPGDYPDSPPLLQIESPVFHPNIAADGTIGLEDIGLSWRNELTMDLVLERIWNVLRGSYVDSQNAINVGAGRWYAKQTRVRLPVDVRPLSGEVSETPNIVRYRRRGQPFPRIRSADRHVIDEKPGSSTRPDDNPIHFID